MDMRQRVADAKLWVKFFNTAEPPIVIKHADRGFTEVYFSIRTTTTRASSIVTTIKRLAGSHVDADLFHVEKHLIGISPSTRDCVSQWNIHIKIKRKER